ncbi:MAG: hypothetical protein J2P18_08895 [Nocardia sp.]|nr:hypothetical protein [Nocardia sp.]
MDDKLNIDPEALHRVAGQHHHAAAAVREYGKVPSEYLDTFRKRHGIINDGIHEALVDFYNWRTGATEHHARKHERIRDNLHSASDAFPDADRSGGDQVHRT